MTDPEASLRVSDAERDQTLRTLGEHIFNRYVEIKRQEWEDYRVQVTPWELERYLSIL